MKRKINHNKFIFTTIKKQDFVGEWPFIPNSVKVGYKPHDCCIVIIDGRDYALNGLTQSIFNLQFPHDAKKAIIGKSISPFLKMAKELNV